MVESELRLRNRRKSLGLLFALPIIGLASACKTETGDDQSVSDKDRQGSQQRDKTGIVGTITSTSDGKPIAGATIDARSLDQSGPPIPERGVQSKPDGLYHWPLNPGAYELTAKAEGYAPMTTQVTVEPKRLTISNFALDRAS